MGTDEGAVTVQDDLEWILEKAKEHEVEAEQQKKKE